MKMEELADSMYVKKTDTVEKYLLNLVQEYFKKSNIASSSSREYIIKRAVERMKEEIEFDQLGVLSITLPDGIKRTGAVNISLEDLLGEPAIVPKRSAFNVSFGIEQNTACEGNDPRLSDKRDPLEHQHEISEIVGLEGTLSTITGKIERINGFLHEHENKSVLDILVYTGEKNTIDLIDLEKMDTKISQIIDDIKKDMNNFRSEIQTKVNEVENKANETNIETDSLKQFITDTNNQYYTQSKSYVDDKINEAIQDIDAKLSEYMSKTELNTLLNIANNVYTLVGSMTITLSAIFLFNSDKKEYEASVPIAASIVNELDNRNKILQNCKTESILEYANDGNIVNSCMPYIIINNNSVNGIVQTEINPNNNSINILINSSTELPDYIMNSKIIFNVYSRQDIAI